MPAAPNTIKLVLVGSSGVGKTSLRGQYISGHFSTGYRATIGTDFISKSVKHPWREGENVVLQIWDTAGQERFSSLSSAFFRGADGVLLMFDVNSPLSLNSLQKWWAEFCDKCPVEEGEESAFCCVVVGNKMDLVHEGEVKEGAQNGTKPQVTKAQAVAFLDELIPPPSTLQLPTSFAHVDLPPPTAVPPSVPPTPGPGQTPAQRALFNLPFMRSVPTLGSAPTRRAPEPPLPLPRLPTGESSAAHLSPAQKELFKLPFMRSTPSLRLAHPHSSSLNAPPSVPPVPPLAPIPASPLPNETRAGKATKMTSPHGTVSSISSKNSIYHTPSSSFFDSYLSNANSPSSADEKVAQPLPTPSATGEVYQTPMSSMSTSSLASETDSLSGTSGYESAVSTFHGIPGSFESTWRADHRRASSSASLTGTTLATPDDSGEKEDGDTTIPVANTEIAPTMARQRKPSAGSIASSASTPSVKSTGSTDSSESSGAKTITPSLLALGMNRSVSATTNATSISASSSEGDAKGKGKAKEGGTWGPFAPLSQRLSPSSPSHSGNLPECEEHEDEELDYGPRLFFTSAKTGDGVSDVFEYVVRRVCARWEDDEVGELDDFYTSDRALGHAQGVKGKAREGSYDVEDWNYTRAGRKGSGIYMESRVNGKRAIVPSNGATAGRGRRVKGKKKKRDSVVLSTGTSGNGGGSRRRSVGCCV